MSAAGVSRGLLLINPTMTSARSARFPLAILNLAAALQARHARPVQTRSLPSVSLLDGNVDRDFVATALRTIAAGGIDAVGMSVMGGPQLLSGIEVSQAIRERFPHLPIIWGGYFASLSATPVVEAPFVDYVVRGQGEETLTELLDALVAEAPGALANIRGLTWRPDSQVVHNPDRPFTPAGLARPLPYELLGNPRKYLGRTFLGARTTGYQAALGCRFRCTFCGVASVFRGKTALPPVERLEQDLEYFTRHLGADSIQFFDHNFFDRETDMLPLLEVLAKYQLPWWCYARADALVNMSERSWALVRKSRLRMAYIGAESHNNAVLHDIRKGTRSDQTLEAVEKCRSQGVIPELSFMLAPPDDPEGETEKTFDFIRHIKSLHPRAEVMIYIYTPLPPGPGLGAPGLGAPVNPHPTVVKVAGKLRDYRGNPVVFPKTLEEWARPEWVRYWCHNDAPWVTPRLRRRIQDFTTVLGCRFPTITDVRAPSWGKAALRALASWRYRFQRYDRPWELDASKRFIKLWDPRVSSL